MADVLKKGELFAPETVTDLFNKVAGKSSLAKLAGTMPIPFNGSEIFTFSMDDEVNIVAENGVKPAGSIALAPIKVVPIKIEYGARVTDEFMFATEEKQLDILKAFNEEYAKKVARAIDIMAMHGLNPRTKEKSALIGTNSFDTNESITKITYDEALIEDNIETAIAAVNEAYDVTGMAMSKTFSSSLAKLKVNGVKQYPELAWGANPGSVNGLSVDVNSTVSFNNSKDKAIVGDFANAFKWGYAKEIPLEIIPYGDPDQSGKDLKANGQIYLRCETYIGWGILDPTAFSRIEAAE
ncbi:MAG TPA: phage major capsid protein [Eubacterium sp.]|jgi:HK97 family phage major capsid protein|nr:phage major capsid protein [Eubacterium sp.]